jgi:hypothetical protein
LDWDPVKTSKSTSFSKRQRVSGEVGDVEKRKEDGQWNLKRYGRKEKRE